MVRDGNPPDLWQALSRSGEVLATDEDYEHGYSRELRGDLRQYVAVRVAEELYGISIDQIVEIAKLFETTPVPRTAPFVLGIGSVRGNVIPIVDLATRLRLVRTGLTRSTRVLIVRHAGELYGLVVDQVVGVISLVPDDLEESPVAFSGGRADFIAALGRHEDEIFIVLQLDRLLDQRDFVAPGEEASESP